MNHSDVIKKILLAEQQAKKIIKEAETKKDTLDADIDESIQKFRRTAEQKAQNRIDAFRKETEINLIVELKKLDDEFKMSLEKLEKLHQSKEIPWTNSLLSVVIDNA